MKQLENYHLVWLADHPGRSEEWLRDRLRDGFHIHHIDGNHSNNASGNLLLMDGDDHMRKLHGMRLHLPRLIERKRPKRVQRKKKMKKLVDEAAAAMKRLYGEDCF